MTDPSFGQEWGPLIAAGVAAIAAGGSWVSAWNARRSWLDTQRPQLAAQLLAPKGFPLLVHARNFGGGPAKKAAFYVVLGREVASGILTADGFLDPGQHTSVALGFDPRVDRDGSQWVLMCLDRGDRICIWPREGKPKIYKQRRWRKPRTIGWYFERYYRRSVPERDLRRVAMTYV